MYRYKAHPQLSEEKCHRLWAVETFRSMWLVSMQYVELGFFFFFGIRQHVIFFFVFSSSARRFFSRCSSCECPPPPAKTFRRGVAGCAFGSNKCTWRKSVIQCRSRLHVYLLGGSKWLLANALIFVALAECTLHGAVLRGDLTSCVGRGGQEASREHMQADPRREAQPGCS